MQISLSQVCTGDACGPYIEGLEGGKGREGQGMPRYATGLSALMRVWHLIGALIAFSRGPFEIGIALSVPCGLSTGRTRNK